MAGVQLDQNSDARKLHQSCVAQGLVECYRLPHHLSGKSDDAVLQFAKSSGRVLLTYDRTIVIEFWQSVLGVCPGIVILSEDDHKPFKKQMTVKSAMKILAVFKG